MLTLVRVQRLRTAMVTAINGMRLHMWVMLRVPTSMPFRVHFWVCQMKQRDQRLVLSSEREFAQSFMFVTTPDANKQSKRDPNIPNRYWFDLPPNWATQVDKDPIIGIGEIYRAGAIRHVKYWFSLELHNAATGLPIEEYTVSFTGHSFLGRDSNFTNFVNDFLVDWKEAYNAKNVELKAAGLTPYMGYDVMINSMRYGEMEEGDEGPWRSGKVAKIIFDTDDGYYAPNGLPHERWLNHKLTSSTVGEVVPHLTFELLNDDAKRLLYGGLDVSSVTKDRKITFTPLWDHNPMYIKSSISSLTEDCYLGHTVSVSIARIRYFRLSVDTRKLWIELYSVRDHKVPSILPEDEEDNVMIEGVVYFDAKFA